MCVLCVGTTPGKSFRPMSHTPFGCITCLMSVCEGEKRVREREMAVHILAMITAAVTRFESWINLSIATELRGQPEFAACTLRAPSFICVPLGWEVVMHTVCVRAPIWHIHYVVQWERGCNCHAAVTLDRIRVLRGSREGRGVRINRHETNTAKKSEVKVFIYSRRSDRAQQASITHTSNVVPSRS